MTTTELRHRVINKVNELTDDNLLMDLIKLIDESSIDNDVYLLSDNHKTAISSAIRQIENGNYLTNVQSDKEIDEWLNK